MSDKKKEKKWGALIGMLIFLAIGGVCGFVIAKFLLIGTDKMNKDTLIKIIILFVGMYVGIFLQIVIHESGHLVFGLLSGYRFSSFRIGSMLWKRENGKLVLKKFKLAGTAGQCLMAPPDLDSDGRIPVLLYNYGGSLMNLIASVILFLIYICLPSHSLFAIFILILIVVGIGFAIANGVPLTGTVNNDGSNALELAKNKDARKAFWSMMKINAMMSEGVRVKEMPEEWFYMPQEALLKNSITSSAGVFYCNRLMEKHCFDEAEIAMKRLMQPDVNLVDIYKKMLISDCIYIALMKQDLEAAKSLYTKEEKKFMKVVKTQPDILRTQYAIAKILNEDEKEAIKICNQLENLKKNYPYPTDVAFAYELIALLDEKNKEESN